MNNIPTVMILFGGSGDLAHRKIYPALFNLYRRNVIRDNFAVIGTARRPWSHEYLREQVAAAVHESIPDVDEAQLTEFAGHFYYQSHDVTNVEHYVTLKRLAQELDERYECGGNRIFYMAMAPSFFGTIAEHIADQHLTGSGFNRLVVEKPFGTDLASAEVLNRQIQSSFAEDQVFRIDHYLGKEMVQNILPLRFGNSLIKKVWNADMVKNVQVTLAERLGVEARGGYYDNSGALRDMVQNHILQIITLLAMPEPKDLSDKAIHAAKEDLLASLRVPGEQAVRDNFVRGQYLGTENTFEYVKEPNVAEDSKTETYVAGRVEFGRGPLAGVPIYFRTGKEMREKKTRVDLVLKNEPGLYGDKAQADTITIEIDPANQIYFRLNGKTIAGSDLRPEKLRYRFSENEQAEVPDGYERLIHDVFVNDSTNFTKWEELKRYWEFVDAIEAAWQEENAAGGKPVKYRPYCMGPDTSKIFADPKDGWIYQ
ncbi:glucose-6-phosphate 1-dehydrogenase [Lactobacillus nasalidis]|uniref:Glucose-6-phosphate 1-dehydrogenase n=1 Tax=Lactobacillus nasalidis TaxID=2797258 RepID=A0ABQ3W5S0_9LACO|nr:glucose-6-phosphate dehydrogenase [Lactobacillus nasalidis]GHV98265.1 glucose-6-phosphate 1-dehydrogenase [Lactobacillus nasalidis]GHV98810.1 glucose-6-phosphate 1-dehydrogenase [Lactobacillus nasalidis]GHW01895.1 glucose-6-phosphate 1-dehydrogenase [Lactobacillus nasalidis]